MLKHYAHFNVDVACLTFKMEQFICLHESGEGWLKLGACVTPPAQPKSPLLKCTVNSKSR